MVIADPYPKRLCSVPGCGIIHRARGYCHKHYRHYILRRGREAKPQALGPNFHVVRALLQAGLRPVGIARLLHISRQRVGQLRAKIEREDRKALSGVV